MDGGDEKKGWNSKEREVKYICVINVNNIHMLMRDAEGRKKEASKAIQTTQTKATQYTQGSHMYMYIITARVKNTAEKRLEEEQERGKEKEGGGRSSLSNDTNCMNNLLFSGHRCGRLFAHLTIPEKANMSARM